MLLSRCNLKTVNRITMGSIVSARSGGALSSSFAILAAPYALGYGN